MECVPVGYTASVTESESGWGYRSDGFILGWDRDLIEGWIAKHGMVLCGDAREYSSIDMPLVMVVLTDHGVASMNDAKETYFKDPLSRPFKWLHGNVSDYVIRR